MKKENFKMRILDKEETTCEFCNQEWKNVEEMYNLKIGDEIYTICRGCVQQLFQKLLTADCRYMGKIKSKEDIQRSIRYNERKNKGLI